MADLAPDGCPVCGFVGECVCSPADLRAALAEREQCIAALKYDLEGVEHDLRVKRAENRRLKLERDQRLTAHPLYRDALDVLEEWKRLCHPGARELGPARIEPVIARLKGGYSVADLIRAAQGYALKPYVVNRCRVAEGNRSDWYADATLIYRDAKRVDDGIRWADHDDNLRTALKPPPPSLPPVGQQLAIAAPEPQLSMIGRAALELVQHDLYVLPCVEGGKVPATRNGLKDAKRDPAVVRRFWGRYPDCNVAVRTGRESGLVVLDVDGDEGMDALHELERRHSELPPTRSVTTPRGGQHFYFKHPGVEIRNTAGYPGPGLDVRGDGGYVLAPPSVGPNGRRYEIDESADIQVMPVWLLRLLKQRQERERQGLSPEERAALIGAGAPEGARDVRLTSHVGWLLHKIDQVGAVRELAHAWNEARLRPPLPRRQVDKIVDSLVRRNHVA